MRLLRALLLSPDWTMSTIRHATSLFDFGRLYDDRTFWEKFDPRTMDWKGTRMKVARKFWFNAAVYSFIVVNALNAFNRRDDEEKEKELADDRRKKDPNYKSPYELMYPDGMKWYDYTMFGNTNGHGTHLFAGRYKNGTECYARWGKQFREIPELFYGRDGLSFPGAAMEKIGAKLNPMVRLGVELWSGNDVNGWANSNMKDKRGWAKELGRLYTIVEAYEPYSIPDNPNKDFKLIDLVMPTSQGMTPSKAIDLFKTGIKGGDLDYTGKVYDACVNNHLNAEQCLKTAAKMVEAEVSKQMLNGVDDLGDALTQRLTEKDPERRARLAGFIRRQYYKENFKQVNKDDAMEMVKNAMEGNETTDEFMKIAPNDLLLKDLGLRRARSAMNEYLDNYKGTPDNSKERYYNMHRPEIEAAGILNVWSKESSSLKRQLGKGNDDYVLAQLNALNAEAETELGKWNQKIEK